MEIIASPSIRDWIYTEVTNNWGRDAREGIHLTDLKTPRRAYWQRIKPQSATFDEIAMWTAGNAFEYKFLKAMGYQKGEPKEWNGIRYNPDIFFNFPAEIKSRRRLLAEPGKEAEIYDWYISQLRGYCAMENKSMGWLLVMSLAEKRDDGSTRPEIMPYEVRFTKEELEVERSTLIRIKVRLELALKKQQWHLLPLCPAWLCGKDLREMTKKPFCETCNREFETEWGLNKHSQSKTGAGHKTKPAEYKTTYEKRCKWYTDCRGENDKS